MPEIAEVRWLVKNLQKELIGVEITGATVSHGSVVQDYKDEPLGSPEAASLFLDILMQADRIGPSDHYKVTEIDRRGKFLLITLSSNGPCKGHVLLSHLGFTGWWVPSWAERTSPRRFLHPMGTKHTKILFKTSKGPLHLTDPRALSRLRLFKDKEAALQSRHLKNMGPDADSDDGIMAFVRALPKTGRRIRDVLMDQQIASGIGNYLCCEILYVARMNGHEIAKQLSSATRIGLWIAIKQVIAQADKDEEKDWWAVFQKKQCPLGHPVTREEWGKRGHYLCYTCQGEPQSK